MINTNSSVDAMHKYPFCDPTCVPGNISSPSESRTAEILIDANSFLREGKEQERRIKTDFKLCVVLGADQAVTVDSRNPAGYSPFF